MEVGEYVRTDKGLIGKVIKKEEYDTHFILEYKGQYCKRVLTTSGTDSEIVKSSPNIIDVIEVGDYVNGMEVTGIGGTRWDENDLHCYCEHNGNENWKQVMIPAKDIRTIVTKEQFKNIEYEVKQ